MNFKLVFYSDDAWRVIHLWGVRNTPSHPAYMVEDKTKLLQLATLALSHSIKHKLKHVTHKKSLNDFVARRKQN